MSSSVKQHIEKTKKDIKVLKAKLAEIHRQDEIELLEQKLLALYQLEMDNEDELKKLDMTAQEEEELREMMEAAHVEVVHVDARRSSKSVRFSSRGKEYRDQEGGNSYVIRRPLPSVYNRQKEREKEKKEQRQPEETPEETLVKKKRFSWSFGRNASEDFDEPKSSQKERNKDDSPPRRNNLAPWPVSPKRGAKRVASNDSPRRGGLRRANSLSFGENLLKKLPLINKKQAEDNPVEDDGFPTNAHRSKKSLYPPKIAEDPSGNIGVRQYAPKEYPPKSHKKTRHGNQSEPHARHGRSKSTSALARVSDDDSGVAQDAAQNAKQFGRGDRKKKDVPNNGRVVDRAYSSIGDYYNAPPVYDRDARDASHDMNRSMSVDHHCPTPVPKRVDRLFKQIDNSAPPGKQSNKANRVVKSKRSTSHVFPRPIPSTVGGSKCLTSATRQPSNITDNTGESEEWEAEREDEIRRLKMPEVFDREYSGLTGYTGHDEGEYDYNCGLEEEDAMAQGGDSAFDLVGSPRGSGVAGRQRSILSIDNISEESSLFEGIPAVTL